MIVGQLPFAKVSSENQRKAFVRGQCLRNFICVRHAECDCHLSIIAGGSPFSPQMAGRFVGRKLNPHKQGSVPNGPPTGILEMEVDSSRAHES
mmetsp:Transcript_11805/g.26975  ORF Transcript_11805/g.26975 Transcript_11805/m.26975 type:complete len:93 (+) Transcript_11805:388-666(+)